MTLTDYTDLPAEERRKLAAEWRGMAREWLLGAYPVGFSFSGNTAWEDGLPSFPNRRELGRVLRELEAEGLLEAWAWTKSKGGHGQTIKVYRVVAPEAPEEASECSCLGLVHRDDCPEWVLPA